MTNAVTVQLSHRLLTKANCEQIQALYDFRRPMCELMYGRNQPTIDREFEQIPVGIAHPVAYDVQVLLHTAVRLVKR
ncbi:hypothetical protein WM25_17235 [Burkholderia ubonensis]|nr:hypothetical protein WM25_17235 [Burkholderia ubonensis]